MGRPVTFSKHARFVVAQFIAHCVSRKLKKVELKPYISLTRLRCTEDPHRAKLGFLKWHNLSLLYI